MVFTAPQILFKRRLISVITLPLLLMLLLAGVSIWQISRLLLAMEWVEHTDQVIAQANRAQRLVTEVESGIRGYLLTDDSAFLAPYQQADVLVEPSFQALITLVSDNPPQVQRLVQMRSRYQEWSKSNPLLIAPKQKGEVPPTAIIKTRNQLMNVIRREMSEFIQTEERLRDARSQRVRRTTQVVIGSSVALATLLGIILAYFIWHQIHSVSRNYEQALGIAKEQTEATQYSAQRLAALHEIDQAILAVQPIELLAHETLLKLKGILAFEQGAVILFNFETNEAQILAGQVAEDTAGAVVPITKQIPLDLLEQCKPICYIKDIATLIHRPSALEMLLAENYHSFLVVPIMVEDKLIGSLNLLATQADAFNLKAQETANEVSSQLAIAIQQSKLRQQLQDYATELEQRVVKRTVQLQEANEQLEAFSYTVAHDLRAPLRGIQGFAQALLEDYGDELDETAHDYIQQVFDGTDRMNNLVQDLLAYSRLSREEIKLTPVRLTQVVAEAQIQLESELRDRNAEIIIAEDLPNAMGHRPTLVQIVVNLLSNAVKFVPPGVQPQIKVWAQEQDNWVRLWVEDNGIGIDPKYQEQIFGVFERLHSRDTYPGTGIGLAIVRKGAERLGGQAGVESVPSQGSRFWVELQTVR